LKIRKTNILVETQGIDVNNKDKNKNKNKIKKPNKLANAEDKNSSRNKGRRCQRSLIQTKPQPLTFDHSP
jgi:hypothetical protein